MTSNFLRAAATIAITLSLAGCGGKATFPITGNVSNLQYPGLVLSTNGMTVAVNPPATTFTFPHPLEYGEVYDVVATSQPQHQNCVPLIQAYVDPATSRPQTLSSDTAGRISTINIRFDCTVLAYTIGGSISGLTSDGLVLTNGSTGGTVPLAAGATSFAFATTVPFGTSYGVAVLTQPANDVCSVQNGTGVMGDAAISNIVVSCVPKS